MSTKITYNNTEIANFKYKLDIQYFAGPGPGPGPNPFNATLTNYPQECSSIEVTTDYSSVTFTEDGTLAGFTMTYSLTRMRLSCSEDTKIPDVTINGTTYTQADMFYAEGDYILNLSDTFDGIIEINFATPQPQGNIKITYNGQVISAFDSGAKILKCKDKTMASDVIVESEGGGGLPTGIKKMKIGFVTATETSGTITINHNLGSIPKMFAIYSIPPENSSDDFAYNSNTFLIGVLDILGKWCRPLEPDTKATLPSFVCGYTSNNTAPAPVIDVSKNTFSYDNNSITFTLNRTAFYIGETYMWIVWDIDYDVMP